MLFILLLLMPAVLAKNDVSLKMTHYNSSMIGLSCHYDYDGDMKAITYYITKDGHPCLLLPHGQCIGQSCNMVCGDDGEDSKSRNFWVKLDGKCSEKFNVACMTVNARRIGTPQESIGLSAQSDPPAISINDNQTVTESQGQIEIVCKVTNMCNKTKIEISSQEVGISHTNTTYDHQGGRFSAIAKSKATFSKAGNYTIFCKEAGKDDIYDGSYILEVRPIKKDPHHTMVTSSIPDQMQPMEFSNVTLSCEVTREGNPMEIIKYTWLKDGEDILGDIQGDQSITLREVTESDEGAYQCLITNSQNILTPLKDAEKFQLDVAPLGDRYHTEVTSSMTHQIQPTDKSDASCVPVKDFSVKPQSDSATIWKYEGEDAILSCPGYIENSRKPILDYEWYQQDYNCEGIGKNVGYFSPYEKAPVIVADEERMSINKVTGELTVRNVGASDARTFTCLFFNQNDQHVATVQLKVKERLIVKGV